MYLILANENSHNVANIENIETNFPDSSKYDVLSTESVQTEEFKDELAKNKMVLIAAILLSVVALIWLFSGGKNKTSQEPVSPLEKPKPKNPAKEPEKPQLLNLQEEEKPKTPQLPNCPEEEGQENFLQEPKEQPEPQPSTETNSQVANSNQIDPETPSTVTKEVEMPTLVTEEKEEISQEFSELITNKITADCTKVTGNCPINNLQISRLNKDVCKRITKNYKGWKENEIGDLIKQGYIVIEFTNTGNSGKFCALFKEEEWSKMNFKALPNFWPGHLFIFGSNSKSWLDSDGTSISC